MRVKVRPSTELEDNALDTMSQLTIRQLIRPSLLTMILCGCFTYNGHCITTGTKSGGRQYQIIGTLYRIFCFLVYITLSVRNVVVVVTPDRFFFLNVTLLINCTQCLMVFLILVKSEHPKYGAQQKAFDFWDQKIRPEIEALGIHFPTKKIQKRQRIYLCMGVLVWATGTAFSTILSFTQFKAYYSSPFPESVPVIIIADCMWAMFFMLWTFPMTYIIIISTVLTFTFEAFNSALESCLLQNQQSKTYSFQRLRRLHLNLCKMVSYLDKDFGYYFAVIVVFSIGFMCTNLYYMLTTTREILDLMTLIFFQISTLFFVGVSSVFAALVHETAHGPLDSIYDICVIDMTAQQIGQLNLFLSKLTGTQIGFTTLGLLTITKEFILTIAGAFLTYFFLLYTTL